MAYTFLQNRTVIALSGEDVTPFLQGLISNDARKLAKGEAIYAALLSPQGKFLHDFFLVPHAEKILLDVDAPRAADLLTRLKMYRLRSKVEITETPLAVAAIWGEGASLNSESFTIIPDPRLPEMGLRAIGEREVMAAIFADKNITPVGAADYEAHRLQHCVPDTCDMVVDKSLLLECGFEELHGVDFNKGCYVGQEVTARSKFRAQLRKGFYSVEGALPEAGQPVMEGGHVLGEMRSRVGNIGIAFLNHEMVALHQAQSEIKISRPAWAEKNIDSDAK